MTVEDLAKMGAVVDGLMESSGEVIKSDLGFTEMVQVKKALCLVYLLAEARQKPSFAHIDSLSEGKLVSELPDFWGILISASEKKDEGWVRLCDVFYVLCQEAQKHIDNAMDREDVAGFLESLRKKE